MSDYESMRRAEDIIAAAERGDFDAALGITPEERDLLTKAQSADALTLADIKALNAMGHHDLTVAAHDAGRIATEEN